MIRRRQALQGLTGRLLATGALPVPVIEAGGAKATPAVPKRLNAATRILEVNGQAARVFGLAGPDGKPGISVAPGERFRVDLSNETDVGTIVHWHGQLPPWTQDGFPWPQTPPLAAGAVHAYDFMPIPGTYWMHSHEGMQEQRLLTAPLIVHDMAELREDRQEVVLMLHDFSFRSPDELLSGLTGMSAAEVHAMGRQVENVPAPDTTSSAPGGDARGMEMMGGGMMGMMGAESCRSRPPILSSSRPPF